MPRIAYISKRFYADSRLMINRAELICQEYQEQGLTLTLRQIYYQFVARGWLENKQTNYDRLGSILNDARLAGMLDWSYMEDRTRFLRSTPVWGAPASIITSAARGYNRDLWETQPYHVEVWIEKDALIGVIEGVCRVNRVGYTACRGYFSQSETWEAGQRFARQIRAGKSVRVLHLGDHDPSGIDMTRDLDDRLTMFVSEHVAWSEIYGAPDNEPAIKVERLALNMDQVEQYNPPPNPAKLTDSRSTDYIARFGSSSWELDALEPTVISTLIQGAIDRYKDANAWDVAAAREDRERRELEAVSQEYATIVEFLEREGYL